MGSFLRRIDLRALLAVAFSATSISLWVTAGEVPPPLLAVTCLTVGNLIGYIGAQPLPARLETVDAPYIPERAG